MRSRRDPRTMTNVNRSRDFDAASRGDRGQVNENAVYRQTSSSSNVTDSHEIIKLPHSAKGNASRVPLQSYGNNVVNQSRAFLFRAARQTRKRAFEIYHGRETIIGKYATLIELPSSPVNPSSRKRNQSRAIPRSYHRAIVTSRDTAVTSAGPVCSSFLASRRAHFSEKREQDRARARARDLSFSLCRLPVVS